MEIKVGFIDSLIETDNPKLLKELAKRYSFYVPGYAFVQSYRRGYWDGKKHFISSKGKFKTGLLNRILEDLKLINCEPKVSYEEPPEVKIQDYNFDKFEQYDYQRAAIDKCLSVRRAIVKSPTGSGKTLIMASIVKALSADNPKMVILFDERSILDQTYRYFTEECGLENIGVCMGKDYLYGDIMLCTVQSISKIFDTHLEESKVLIVDEVHKFSRGEVSVAAINSFPNASYRFGFTATLPADTVSQYVLEGAFGQEISTRSAKELIQEKVLAKPEIQVFNLVQNLDPEDYDLSYMEIYDKFIINSESRNSLISNLCKKIDSSYNKARVCILVKNLDHLRLLSDLIGENAFTLEGANSVEDRQYIINDFISCENTSFLLGTKVLQTGINIKEITHLINARGLKDRIPTLQGLGRGMRSNEGKDKVMVYDFLDNAPYLEDHSKERIKHYKKEGYEIKVITI